MAQLMHHDAVDHLRRRQHQQAVEIEIALRGTAAPPRALAADRNAAECHADARRIEPDARRDIGAGMLGKGFQLFLCQRPLCFGCFFTLLCAFAVCFDPVPVAQDKIVDGSLAHPHRRTNKQRPVRT